MEANNQNGLPLYEKVDRRNIKQRSLDIIILLLFVCLLTYRLLHIRNQNYGLAFLCECWFTFVWALITNIKWNPLGYKTYPQNLHKLVEEFPLVDMFVTTADPELEPPILTVNTVLSLLAVNYPSHKLGCYVSDDACSPLTYYSLVEALKFAQLWIPFVKKYDVEVRAPFRFFVDDVIQHPSANSHAFQHEWKIVKNAYEQLVNVLENAEKKDYPFHAMNGMSVFSGVERGNHPAIIKVIWENKGEDDVIPNLVYISREKRPQHKHNYKAGAMNVLARVSGLMTNAPFMLNVDCDMYAHNPDILRHVMCFVFGSIKDDDCGFVQSPQLFYDCSGSDLEVLHETIGYGAVGIQGPVYQGSGCVHRRKVIYGLNPGDENTKMVKPHANEFGNSKVLLESVSDALNGKTRGKDSKLSDSIDAAYEVARCSYEYDTQWGKEFGWIYGSTSEDVHTGMKIHSRGWKSLYCTPDPPAFLGCTPSSGTDILAQQRRWAAGLLEIFFTRNNPILGTLYGKLQLRMCMAYMWANFWAINSIPHLSYILLPAYCIITNSTFLPKGQEPSIYILVSLFVLKQIYALSQYLKLGLSVQSWWINMTMTTIVTTSSFLFSCFDVMLKLLGLSDIVFNITRKPSSSTSNYPSADIDNVNEFIFDESPYFVPGTTVLLVHLTAMASFLFGWQRPRHDGNGCGLGEVLVSVWVLVMFSPFLKGLFKKGKYGVPMSTIYKSSALALLFVSFSLWNTSV